MRVDEIATDDVPRFLDGLDLARSIVARLGLRDPDRLRAAADQLEARGGSALEAGCAAGYRLIADDLEDGLVGG